MEENSRRFAKGGFGPPDEKEQIMGKRSKVYLPRWHRWFIHPMLLLIWCVTTYAAFWAPERDQESVLGWVIATVVLLGVGIVTWLMTSGKLPAYIIEEESTE